VTGLTILGSTGSIGLSTLDVVARHPDRYRIVALSANRDVAGLLRQCRQFRPEYAVMADPVSARELNRQLRAEGVDTQVLEGVEGLQTVAGLDQVDQVMAAIVGAAGLLPVMAAARAGKRILLANKEALVVAGALFMEEVARHGAHILPIDSEHNAVFQCLPADFPRGLDVVGVRRILLTASGGPFRSATPDRIDVVLHPQSVIHSMVEYTDGSVLAQLGNPDMRTPIAHALAWPERIDSGVSSLDLFQVARLDFEAPDLQRFPCLRLAYQAIDRGDSAPAILNAANEVAVAAFLQQRLGFLDIPRIIEATLSGTVVEPFSSLEQVLEVDRQARLLAERTIGERV